MIVKSLKFSLKVVNIPTEVNMWTYELCLKEKFLN